MSTLFVFVKNVQWLQKLFRSMDLKVVTVSHYLGGLLGDGETHAKGLG